MTCLCRLRGEAQVQFQPICNMAPEGGGWSVPGFNCFNPGKDPVSTVQETRWATGLMWTTHNNPPRIRSPDHAVSSELLYQLYYPSRHKYVLGSEIFTETYV
jgi:hypothetical protein